jgi:hypothetical protein
MRDTEYATELARASLPLGASELRLERLRIKSSNTEEIRWSWWSDGRLAPRPLDLSETQLLELMRLGMEQGVFTTDFLLGLTNRIQAHLATK